MKLKTTLLALAGIFLGLEGRAQECVHTNLSKKYNYQVSVEEAADKNGVLRISRINVKIIDKATNLEQQALVVVTSKKAQFSEDCFKKCSQVRSDITNVNTSAASADLIITDLNFDGEEDLMVKSDCGGSGNASYTFFTRSTKETFAEDRFLTREFKRYPNSVNQKTKSVSLIERANAWGKTENVYEYDSANRRWVRTKTLFH